jgi:hypothetical protein
MPLAEPMTVATDYLLAAVAAGLGARLLRQEQRSARVWGLAFLATAAAGVVGGSWHGFQPRLTPAASTALWLVTYAAIGVANLLMLAGAFTVFVPPRLRPLLNALLVLRFLLYFALLASRQQFRYVVYDYGLTLAVLLACGMAAVVTRRPSGPWLLAAVALSFAGALVQRSGIRLHEHFNHNDLFHVVQTVALWLFYRAGQRLGDGRS